MSKPSPTPPNRRLPPGTSKPRASRAGLPPPTASEAAFERLLAHFDDPEGAAVAVDVAVASADVAAAEPQDAARFLSDLFARKAEFLVRDRFATIGEADEFFTKIVGVSFEGRQDLVAGLRAGDALTLEREPDNAFDPSAIAVRYGTLHLGFLRREIASKVAPKIDAGDSYAAVVGSVTGGGARHVGVNIHVRRRRATGSGRARREEAAREAQATDSVRVALIGERPLRDAQHAVLARVAAGRNTLAVLGTGRGKSLCFQLPAAERALAHGAKTLVFYPLRALANDQFDALTRRLARFGLRILRANGAIDGDERGALDDALETGAWDVILSTPEFVTFHRAAFLRACNRPELVVVDEAHHVFESRHRPAYGTLGAFVRELGTAQVLALTATANDEAFREIRRALEIDAWVIDPTVRENLHVVDARNATDKSAYLARELAGDGKAIVYCNSRAEVTKMADRLRARLGDTVAFYHAGIPTPERAEVENLFRSGVVRTIVATSAFGEGIDLPDVRDVVLYHLNFDLTEFNQMSGRAGRDGLDARIHLLYGEKDRSLNDYILGCNAPSVETLRELYRGMHGLASEGVLRTNYEDVARILSFERVKGSTVSAAVRIFEEGGLVSTGLDDDGRFVRFLDVTGKVDLTKTTRFAEGQAERDAFDRFCNLALEADAATLERIINRPIYPDRVPLEN
jgi:single-stranded-DNA-specific exonuclease